MRAVSRRSACLAGIGAHARSQIRWLAGFAARGRLVRQYPRPAGLQADLLSRLLAERALPAFAGVADQKRVTRNRREYRAASRGGALCYYAATAAAGAAPLWPISIAGRLHCGTRRSGSLPAYARRKSNWRGDVSSARSWSSAVMVGRIRQRHGAGLPHAALETKPKPRPRGIHASKKPQNAAFFAAAEVLRRIYG